MANFEVPKDAIEGRPAVPSGIYKLRCDGFKPKLSSKRDSYNLNPILKVIEPEEFRDATIFYNMNSNFGPGVTDFVHANGQLMVQNPETGNYKLPGKFDGPDDDVEKWVYSGPLLGSVSEAEILEVPKQVKDPQSPGKYMADPSGKTQNDVKRFLCAVKDCTERHSDNLSGQK